jgi:hypothetical protein
MKLSEDRAPLRLYSIALAQSDSGPQNGVASQ